VGGAGGINTGVFFGEGEGMIEFEEGEVGIEIIFFIFMTGEEEGAGWYIFMIAAIFTIEEAGVSGDIIIIVSDMGGFSVS
jgi:hypothetical protein